MNTVAKPTDLGNYSITGEAAFSFQQIKFTLIIDSNQLNCNFTAKTIAVDY